MIVSDCCMTLHYYTPSPHDFGCFNMQMKLEFWPRVSVDVGVRCVSGAGIYCSL